MGMREMREEFGSAIRAGEKGGKSTWVARSSFSPVVDNIVERSQRSERFGGCERVVEGRNSVFSFHH